MKKKLRLQHFAELSGVIGSFIDFLTFKYYLVQSAQIFGLLLVKIRFFYLFKLAL
jgi:hypothetical protein